MNGPTAAVLGDPRLVELGVDPPSRVRLARAATEAGIDPRRVAAVLA
jgi:hypothetical protein